MNVYRIESVLTDSGGPIGGPSRGSTKRVRGPTSTASVVRAMAANSASDPQPDAGSGSVCGVTVTTDTASGQTYPYWPFDPDLIKQWEWLSLPEAERKRALTVQAAMNKARYNNPLAY